MDIVMMNHVQLFIFPQVVFAGLQSKIPSTIDSVSILDKVDITQVSRYTYSRTVEFKYYSLKQFTRSYRCLELRVF